MPKPFYLGFEDGIRAISGVPFLPINNWRDFKKINRQLTSAKNLEKTKELYQTIIFDEVFTAAIYCQEYLCGVHGVETISEGNSGYGLWSEYFNEFWGEINKLLKSGFTLFFIGHEQFSKNEDKLVPKGDVRSMQIVRDNADLVMHLRSNGVDEDGNVINSSAWFAETENFFARSRFDHMPTYLESFTAENLEKAVAFAVSEQEKEDGVDAVTFEEQKESYESDELEYDALMDEIKTVGKQLVKEDKLDQLNEVAEQHLGKGMSVTECEKGQEQVMAVILDQLKELLEDK